MVAIYSSSTKTAWFCVSSTLKIRVSALKTAAMRADNYWQTEKHDKSTDGKEFLDLDKLSHTLEMLCLDSQSYHQHRI